MPIYTMYAKTIQHQAHRKEDSVFFKCNFISIFEVGIEKLLSETIEKFIVVSLSINSFVCQVCIHIINNSPQTNIFEVCNVYLKIKQLCTRGQWPKIKCIRPGHARVNKTVFSR